jgi:hypothetical protein
VVDSGSGEVLQLGGGIRVLGPSQKRKRNAGVKLTEEGNIDDASARWRPTEEAASVDGGGPDGARQLQGWGGKGAIKLPQSKERGAQRGRSP